MISVISFVLILQSYECHAEPSVAYKVGCRPCGQTWLPNRGMMGVIQFLMSLGRGWPDPQSLGLGTDIETHAEPEYISHKHFGRQSRINSCSDEGDQWVWLISVLFFQACGQGCSFFLPGSEWDVKWYTYYVLFASTEHQNGKWIVCGASSDFLCWQTGDVQVGGILGGSSGVAWAWEKSGGE